MAHAKTLTLFTAWKAIGVIANTWHRLEIKALTGSDVISLTLITCPIQQ